VSADYCQLVLPHGRSEAAVFNADWPSSLLRHVLRHRTPTWRHRQVLLYLPNTALLFSAAFAWCRLLSEETQRPDISRRCRQSEVYLCWTLSSQPST